MDNKKIIENAIRYIEKILKDSMESENRTGEIKYALCALIAKIDDTRELITQFILIVDSPYQRVLKRIRYRLKNNFLKYFDMGLSYIDNHPYGTFGPISLLEYQGSSTFNMTMSTTINWFTIPSMRRSFIANLYTDHNTTPLNLSKYLIPERWESHDTYPIISEIEDRYNDIIHFVEYQPSTVEEEWNSFIRAYNEMYGTNPPAMKDFHILTERTLVIQNTV